MSGFSWTEDFQTKLLALLERFVVVNERVARVQEERWQFDKDALLPLVEHRRNLSCVHEIHRLQLDRLRREEAFYDKLRLTPDPTKERP
jgi:hypothetical protein